MIGCLLTRVRKQPITAFYFEFENELKFYSFSLRKNSSFITLGPITKRSFSSTKDVVCILINSSDQLFKCLIHLAVQSMGSFIRTHYITHKKAKEFFNTKPPSNVDLWSIMYTQNVILMSLFLLLIYHPPYSPDRSPCDFFLFISKAQKYFLKIN